MSLIAAGICAVITPIAWYWTLHTDLDQLQRDFELSQNNMTYGYSVDWMYDVMQHAGDEGWNPDHFETQDANGEWVDVYFRSKEESQWVHYSSLPHTHWHIRWPQSWQ